METNNNTTATNYVTETDIVNINTAIDEALVNKGNLKKSVKALSKIDVGTDIIESVIDKQNNLELKIEKLRTKRALLNVIFKAQNELKELGV